MLFSDRDIHAAIARGRIAIKPFNSALVQPASVDVCLGHEFRMFRGTAGALGSRGVTATFLYPEDLDPDAMDLLAVEPGAPFVFYPGTFVLGATVETITLDRTVAAQIEGKSSLGRLGLVVHSTAGFIDPGFSGQITLELSNVGPHPIVLRPGMRIGQVCFTPMSSPVDRPYGSAGLGSHYQGQQGPTPARSG